MQKRRVFVLDFSVHLTPASFSFQASTVWIISISKYNIACMDCEWKALLQRCASLNKAVPLRYQRHSCNCFPACAIWRCLLSHWFSKLYTSTSPAYLTSEICVELTPLTAISLNFNLPHEITLLPLVRKTKKMKYVTIGRTDTRAWHSNITNNFNFHEMMRWKVNVITTKF